MSASSRESQGNIPDNSVFRIIVTNSSHYHTKPKYAFTMDEIAVADIQLVHRNSIHPSIKATILVVQGYKNLDKPYCLGNWMAQNDQLRSIVHQYLSPSEQRYWSPRAPANCQDITAAHWIRPVAQTQRKVNWANKVQASFGEGYIPDDGLDPPGPPGHPEGPTYRKFILWPDERLQPSHILCRTESANLTCFAAEERVFYHAWPADHDTPKPADGR